MGKDHQNLIAFRGEKKERENEIIEKNKLIVMKIIINLIHKRISSTSEQVKAFYSQVKAFLY